MVYPYFGGVVRSKFFVQESVGSRMSVKNAVGPRKNIKLKENEVHVGVGSVSSVEIEKRQIVGVN